MSFSVIAAFDMMEEYISIEENTLRHLCDPFGIELIFLLGSHARNQAAAKSDLDIGVYLCNRLSAGKIWELQCSLMDIYKRSDVDLIILNDASPLLLFDLFKNHKLIYKRDDYVLYNFFSWARKRYWQYQSHFKKYALQLENTRLRSLGIIR